MQGHRCCMCQCSNNARCNQQAITGDSNGQHASMAAMFVNGRGVLMDLETPFDKGAICVCIYIMNVLDVQRPNFLMVVSLFPWSLKAIAPPARSE